jgi:hypothetical protein
MKIIIAPSKTQDYTNPSTHGLEMVNQDKTLKLFEMLKDRHIDELAKLLKIKNNLLDQTYDLYQSFNPKQKMYKAIDIYEGVVFQQLDKGHYNEIEVDFLNEHLVILSAMYGPLKANTLIWPYRLDMTIKPNDINLYQYWQDDIDCYFDDQEIIINLASNEFSKMIKKQRKNMVNIDFKDKKDNGKLRTISYNAKKARGQMLDMIIKNQINQVNDIKKLDIDGYRFSDIHSKEKHLIFVK